MCSWCLEAGVGSIGFFLIHLCSEVEQMVLHMMPFLFVKEEQKLFRNFFSLFFRNPSRMSPSQDKSRNPCSSEPLAKCLQAKKDLETAISGIVKAEQQIKENWQEVMLNSLKICFRN